MSGKGGGGGWLSANKSTAQIARAQKKAKDNRRQRRGAPPLKAKKKRQEWIDDDSEDDEEMDDFLVHDAEELLEEEEEEADWSEQDEEEEEELEEDDDISENAAPASSKRSKRKPKSKALALDDSSEEEEEDDDDDFFSSWNTKSKRKSKPAPHMLKGSSKRRANDDDVEVLTSPEEQRKPAGRARKKRTMTDCKVKAPKLAAKKPNRGKQTLVSLLSSDDDDDDELLKDPFARSDKKARPTAAKTTTTDMPTSSSVSRFFVKKSGVKQDDLASAVTSKSSSSDLQEETVDDDEQMAIALAMSESMNQNYDDNQPGSTHDDEPTPVVARRSKASKSRAIDDDNDDDEQESRPAARQLQSAIDLSDSDEEITAKQPVKKGKNRFSKFAAKNQKSVLEILDDSDDEEKANDEEPEDEDDNYGDEEVDEDAKEARSILEAAKRLSGQILQTLKTWGGSGGMIVQDGAIAFDGLSIAEIAADASSCFISNETMEKACPNVKLAPFQLIGVNWLALLHKLTVEVNGKATSVNGVLADEMGLGKTCQTISFLGWLKYQQQNGEGPLVDQSRGNDPIVVESDEESVESVENRRPEVSPHLIVVPASVLTNWVNEFKKFAPHLNVVKFHGTMAEREEIKAYLRQFTSGRARRGGETVDVIIVPITYFQKEKSDDRSFLKKFRYDYLVCDEGHLLKNHEGMRYKTLDKFRTKHRLLLTGTPVMNNPQELMSLLCFLMPLFSRKSQEFGMGDEGNDGGARMLQHFVSMDNQSENDPVAYRKIKELFAPFVLRRRKDDVLSQVIPPKTRKVEFVELDPAGRQTYNGILEKHLRNKNRGAREHLFTQLRKSAHHPLLLRTRYLKPSETNHLIDSFYKHGAFKGEGCTRERVKNELERYSDFEIHLTALDLLHQNPSRESDLDRYVLREEDLYSSAKCQRLRTLLPEIIGEGHRVLLFSVWTTCLDLLSCLLEQLGLKYMRMDGSTPVEERQDLIDEFNRVESVPIFLLSTKACGTGINLTAADTCIVHDCDFNPANDEQAESRCHRIGQKKPVTVYKLVAKDTVDHDIYCMQERKSKMSAAIMESSSDDFDSKKERENVLQNAVNRFLGSPAAVKSKENEPNGVIQDDL